MRDVKMSKITSSPQIRTQWSRAATDEDNVISAFITSTSGVLDHIPLIAQLVLKGEELCSGCKIYRSVRHALSIRVAQSSEVGVTGLFGSSH